MNIWRNLFGKVNNGENRKLKFISTIRASEFMDCLRLTFPNKADLTKVSEIFNVEKYLEYNFQNKDSTKIPLFFYFLLKENKVDKVIPENMKNAVHIKTLDSNKFLQITILMSDELVKLCQTTMDKNFKIPPVYNDYIRFKRDESDYFDKLRNDNELVNSHAFSYLDKISNIKKFFISNEGIDLNKYSISLISEILNIEDLEND